MDSSLGQRLPSDHIGAADAGALYSGTCEVISSPQLWTAWVLWPQHGSHSGHSLLTPVLANIPRFVDKPSMFIWWQKSHVASLGAASGLAYRCGLQPSPPGRAVHYDPGVTLGVTHVWVQWNLKLSPNQGGNVWEGGTALTGNSWVN